MKSKAKSSRYGNIRKLGQLIQGIRVAMLTSLEHDGHLHSRPMVTQQTDFDGSLWFFTRHHTPKVNEVERDHQVSVTYVDSEQNRYITVSGAAEVVDDRQKAAEMWSPFHRAWFPRGLADPELRLLRVEVEHAEVWDAPSSAFVRIVGFAKALLTRKEYYPGRSEKLDLAG